MTSIFSASNKTSYRSFLDATLLLTIITAVAYFFGYGFYVNYWRFLGVPSCLLPDTTMPQILRAGGYSLFTISLLIFAFFIISFKFNKKFDVQSMTNIRRYMLMLISVILFLTLGTLNSIAMAWVSYHSFKNNIPKIEHIELKGDRPKLKSDSLSFLGMKGRFVMLREINDRTRLKTILLAQEEIISIKLRR